MTEAQTWTVIATLSAALLGMITVVTTVLMRTISTQIGSVRNEMLGLRAEMLSGFDSVRGELRSEIGGLRSEIGGLRAEMNARFETVGVRMDSLDRDVQAVASRVFGTDRP